MLNGQGSERFGLKPSKDLADVGHKAHMALATRGFSVPWASKRGFLRLRERFFFLTHCLMLVAFCYTSVSVDEVPQRYHADGIVGFRNLTLSFVSVT